MRFLFYKMKERLPAQSFVDSGYCREEQTPSSINKGVGSGSRW